MPKTRRPPLEVVDRAGHVGEQVRVAVRVTGHQRTELDARSRLRPGREQRPALEVRAIGRTVEGIEVVPRIENVGTELLGAQRRPAHPGHVAVLRMDLHSDAYSRHGCAGCGLPSWESQRFSDRRIPPLHSGRRPVTPGRIHFVESRSARRLAWPLGFIPVTVAGSY